MTHINILTIVREALAYDALSGELRWKHRPPSHFADMRAWKLWNTRCAFRVAGSKRGEGNAYRTIHVLKKTYLEHRLIWFMVTGEWPADQIDHSDWDKSNNRWANLSSVSRSENNRNRPRLSSNTSGVCGVRYHSLAKKWTATYKLHGKSVHCGLHSTREAAAVAVQTARNQTGAFSERHGK